MTTTLRRFATDEQGQDLAEYALLVALVTLVVIGLANGFHDSIAGITDTNGASLASASMAIK